MATLMSNRFNELLFCDLRDKTFLMLAEIYNSPFTFEFQRDHCNNPRKVLTYILKV